MVENAGYAFWDLYRCRTFDDYMDMAEAKLNIVYEPLALMAAEELKKRLGQEYLYLSFSFDFDELEDNYRKLAAALETEKPDFSGLQKKADEAMLRAKEVIGDTPVAVDYTFTFRILSFARMLLEYGFRVTEIYADAFAAEDEENFRWIREHFPDVIISATNRPEMRFLYHGDDAGDGGTERPRVLAVGQKAAYFAGTPYFVNMVEGNGYQGIAGARAMVRCIAEAYDAEKDTKDLVPRKGLGCESCL